jgi:hypothetical protein
MKGAKKTLMNIIQTVFVALVIGFVYFFAMRTGQKDLKKRNAPPFFIKLLQVLTILGLIGLVVYIVVSYYIGYLSVLAVLITVLIICIFYLLCVYLYVLWKNR